MPWAIFDKNRQYINIRFSTKQSALEELHQLLLPYPEGHAWRSRLQVKMLQESRLVEDGEPPYGYIHQESKRYGQHMVEFQPEQRVLRLANKMHQLGMTHHQIAKRLNTHNRRPRHGRSFTPLMIDELLQARRRHGEGRGDPFDGSYGAHDRVAEATGA